MKHLYSRYRFKNEGERAVAYHHADCDVVALRKEGKRATMRFAPDYKSSAYVVEIEENG
jgi:hypothetical protein